MRFVRLACTFDEQNILLHESADNRLYFRTSRPIGVQQELRIGYSPAYALRYGLPLLQPNVSPSLSADDNATTTTTTIAVADPTSDPGPAAPLWPDDIIGFPPPSGYSPLQFSDIVASNKPPGALTICDTWHCFECHHKFDTFSQLQQHLNEAHMNINATNYPDRIALALLPERRRRRQRAQRRRRYRKVVGVFGATVRYDCRHCAQVFSKYAALIRHCDQEHNNEDVGENGNGVTMETDVSTADDDDDDDDGGEVDEEADDDGVNADGEDYFANVDLGHEGETPASAPQSPITAPAAHIIEPSLRPNRRTSAQHKCTACRRYFSGAAQLAAHQRLHHVDVEQRVQCPHCPRRLLSASALAMHMRKHTPAAPSEPAAARFRCVYCAAPCANARTLNEHVVRLHSTSDHKFCCPERNACRTPLALYETYASVRKHVNAVHSAALHECPACGRRFRQAHQLRLHRRIHETAGGQFACQLAHGAGGCQRRFHRRDKMLEHVRRVHANGTDERVGNAPPIAGRAVAEAFRDVADEISVEMFVEKTPPKTPPAPLRRHRRKPASTTKRIIVFDADVASERSTAKQRRSSTCAQFTDLSTTNAALQPAPYACAACEICFKRRGMLVNHMARAHPNVELSSVPVLRAPIVQPQRQYCCPYCPKVYGSHSKRRLHCGKQHPDRAAPESLPSQRRTANAELSAEAFVGIRTVGTREALPHPCDWCHKQYATRQRLLRHHRQAHSVAASGTTSIGCV